MDATRELLIQIRMALDSGAGEEALRLLDSLEQRTESINARQSALGTQGMFFDADTLEAINRYADAAKTASGPVEALGENTSNLARVAVPARQALQGVAALVRGDMTSGTTNLAQAMARLQGAITPAVGALAGFGVGWGAGRMIDETFGLSDAIAKRLVPPAEEFHRLARLTREELDQWGKTTFQGLIDEIDSAVTRLKAIKGEIDEETARRIAEEEAKRDLRIAEIEATQPEGPDRKEAIAKVRSGTAVEIDQLKSEARQNIVSEAQGTYEATQRANEEAQRLLKEARAEYASYLSDFKIVAREFKRMMSSGETPTTAQYRGYDKFAQEASSARGRLSEAEKKAAEASEAFAKARQESSNLESSAQYEERMQGVRTQTREYQDASTMSAIDAERQRAAEAAERASAKTELQALKDELKTLQTDAAALRDRKGGADASGDVRVALSHAAREAADVSAAQSELSGAGAGFSPKSFSAQKAIASAEKHLAQQQAEFEAAVSAIEALHQANAQAMERVTQRIGTLENQVRSGRSI